MFFLLCIQLLNIFVEPAYESNITRNEETVISLLLSMCFFLSCKYELLYVHAVKERGNGSDFAAGPCSVSN